MSYGTSVHGASSSSFFSRTAFGWAPTLTSHDPSYPLPLESASGITSPVGTSTETDTSQGLSRVKARGVGMATETNTASFSSALPSGPTLHLDFSDTGTLTLVSGDISVAADQSGNGYDFSQGGAPYRPASAVDGVIGQAAIFDGIANELTSTATVDSIASASAYTIVARVNAYTTPPVGDYYGAGILVDEAQVAMLWAQDDGGSGAVATIWNGDGSEDEASAALTLNTEQVIIARHTAGNIEVRIGNGTPVSTASGNTTPLTGLLHLGQTYGGEATTFDGAISHVIVWDRALTEGEIDDVLGYLAGTGGGIAAVKIRAVGLSTETDTALALALAGGISEPVGTSAETDAALNLGRVKVRTTGASAESDAAQGLTASKHLALSTSTETDAAPGFGIVKARALGLSTETDAVLGLSRIKARALSTATETDTALSLGAVKVLAFTTSTETDTALALDVGSSGFSAPAGQSDETDTAGALAAVKVVALSTATETDSAQALSALKVGASGVSSETDASVSLSYVKVRATGQADETDTALDLGRVKVLASVTSTETDAALALAPTKARTVTASTEVDAALTLGKALSFQPATETDTSLALSAGSVFSAPVGVSTETDAAPALVASKGGASGVSSETDTALPLAPYIIESHVFRTRAMWQRHRQDMPARMRKWRGR